MNRLIDKVEKWAEERGLIPGNTKYQTVKLMEEIGELAEGIIKDRPEQVKDGIGDAVVVLIILSRQVGLTLEECLEYAYNEIKDRTGKTVDSVFVKESDTTPFEETSSPDKYFIPFCTLSEEVMSPFQRDFFNRYSTRKMEEESKVFRIKEVSNREYQDSIIFRPDFIPTFYYFIAALTTRDLFKGEVGIIVNPEEFSIIVVK